MNLQVTIQTDDDRIARLCEDYWRQDDAGAFPLRVSDLAEAYSLKAQEVSRLVSQNADVCTPDVACQRCEAAYSVRTRSDYQQAQRLAKSKSAHVCRHCLDAEQRAEEARQRQVIESAYQQAVAEAPRTVAELDFKTRLYLLSVVMPLGDKKFKTIRSMDGPVHFPISPYTVRDREILAHLVSQKVILPSIDSGLNCLEPLSDKDLSRCTFDITLPESEADVLLNGFCEDSVKASPEFWEALRDVQMAECLGYLTEQLNEYGLSFSPGKKTHAVFTRCLEQLSVSQVHDLIGRAASRAADYYATNDISKRRAANSAIGNIERIIGFAQEGKWEIRPSLLRSPDLPQSAISRIIFNLVLGTEDGGFHQALNDIVGSRATEHQMPDTPPETEDQDAPSRRLDNSV